ncbi:MAG: ABC transporter permease [Candidatus Melainabacteria bacterium]|nr:MAG: ABC transporter permease [Candidatus Melainabacteria bacterium]
MSKYFYIALTSIRSRLAYLGELGSKTIFLFVVLYIFLCLWKVTYAETNQSSLGGLSLKQMLWYLVVTESIIMSLPTIATLVDQDVRTGALAMQLVRPMSYPLNMLAQTSGERVLSFALNFLVGSIIALIFVGPLDFNLSGIAMFLLLIPLSFALDFTIYFLIGLAAFWLEDTTGLTLIYSRMTMILGGMLIPLELFPDGWQQILRVLPFSAIVYGPARVFVTGDLQVFLSVLIQQIVAILVFAFVIRIVYNLALRRVFSHGG